MNNENTLSMLVTVAEAARLLSVSDRTIRRMIADKRLVSIRPVADAIRITRASLDALVSTTHAETPTEAS